MKRALRGGGYGKFKVGHGGTLDPLASGVLPVAIGEATKLAGRMLDSDKVYAFTVRFGEQTDTLDAEGAVIAASDGAADDRGDRRGAGAASPGRSSRCRRRFSALKVDGRRAYDLARAGEEVALKTRAVTIHSLTRHPGLVPGSAAPQAAALADEWMPEQVRHDGVVDEATLTAHVSKGTYIRSLARDIALALGSVGHVTMLRRLKAGPFGLAGAISLDKRSPNSGRRAALKTLSCR